MKRFVPGGMVVASLALLMLGTGCADPKQKRIDELGREVSQLNADLQAAQAERQKAADALARYQAENQGLQGQVQQMQSQMGELEQRLASAQSEAAKPNPVMKNGWIQAPGVAMISVSSDLLFGSGKADLTGAGSAKIAEIAREIRKEYSSRDIYVIGHTDTDPIRKTKWKDNWELSAARALTVTRALQASGVSGRQIMAAGRGEYQPQSATKARNRRVEIFAVQRSGHSGAAAARTNAKGPTRTAGRTAKR